VRAGFAFAQSLDVAAKRMGPPISVELNRVLLDISMGGSTEDALSAMNERICSDDVDMVVTAILIQRSSGGNLAEILDVVAETMRDRERVQGEIKTLTASQQLTGWILSLWPAALALGFFAITPSTMSRLWTTDAGLVLLGMWLTLNTLGVVSLRRILDIDV
jgi:tight adherence protein B